MTWVLVCLILVLDVLIAVDWLVMSPRAKRSREALADTIRKGREIADAQQRDREDWLERYSAVVDTAGELVARLKGPSA